ncbi:MAG: heparan-alpha-glucosaminide N-acetyltransferase domain-containing protein [Clostridium sp.]|nr:heparan-alpha-glucosaminide N-acetyltransferase domain-containing protein [Clostridium sp.]
MRNNSARIYAIDALRGLTVAAMIVVNNAGGKQSYACLRHSDWNGLTLCDMVFPSFLFLVGLSTYISFSKTGFAFTSAAVQKILKRTLLILLIGWGIHFIEILCHGETQLWGHLRLTGVLPRIGICYFFTAMLAISVGKKAIYAIIIGLLATYSIILIYGNGYANDFTNIISKIDHAILGEGHIYTKRPIDPEGLLGSISGIAHTLIGFCFGGILIRKGERLDDRLLLSMAVAFGMLLCGWAVAAGLPINKRIWSPSYVLTSCALTAMALSTIGYLTDIKGEKAAFRFFDVFGVNPLFLYVLSELASIALGETGLKGIIYAGIHRIIADPCASSAAYSMLLMMAMWCAGYPLYKKKIYIKI